MYQLYDGGNLLKRPKREHFYASVGLKKIKTTKKDEKKIYTI